MSVPVINEDELIGYIMRNAYNFEGARLDYEDVSLILKLEIDFLKSKGLIETEKKVDKDKLNSTFDN